MSERDFTEEKINSFLDSATDFLFQALMEAISIAFSLLLFLLFPVGLILSITLGDSYTTQILDFFTEKHAGASFGIIYLLCLLDTFLAKAGIPSLRETTLHLWRKRRSSLKKPPQDDIA